jgi:hypothetical protein
MTSFPSVMSPIPSNPCRFSAFYRDSYFYPLGEKVAVPLIAEFVGMALLTFIGAAQQCSFSSLKPTPIVRNIGTQ